VTDHTNSLDYESFCRDCGMVTRHVEGSCTRCHPPVKAVDDRTPVVTSKSCHVKRRNA